MFEILNSKMKCNSAQVSMIFIEAKNHVEIQYQFSESKLSQYL